MNKEEIKALKEEFGIHFKSSGEFQFLCEFIDELLVGQREDIIKKLNSWDLGAMPETTDFADGWNDCRYHFGKGKKLLITKIKENK